MKVLLLVALLPFVSGCIGSAHAQDRTKKIVNYEAECKDPCKKPHIVTMYRQDGTVETLLVAVNSVAGLVGCYCPAPPSAEKK